MTSRNSKEIKNFNTERGIKQEGNDPVEYRGRSGSLAKFSGILESCHQDPRAFSLDCILS